MLGRHSRRLHDSPEQAAREASWLVDAPRVEGRREACMRYEVQEREIRGQEHARGPPAGRHRAVLVAVSQKS